MSILITGGAGYIGSQCVLALLDAGQSVIVVDDLSTGNHTSIHEKAHFIKSDIGDETRINTLFRDHPIEAIIHFAASISVPDSVRSPMEYYHNNVVKSQTLINTALKANVKRFIFSSTAAVYGTPESVPIPESANLKPISPYGASKMMVERMIEDAAIANLDFKFCALRYFNVAGADPKLRSGQRTMHATHLIHVACRALLKGEDIPVYGRDYPTHDGTAIRDYIHVNDLIEAHLLSLNHLRNGGQSHILNCGYGRGYSVLEVLAALEKVSGKTPSIRNAQRRPGDAATLIADNSALCSTLAFAPNYDSIEAIVASAFEWEKHLFERSIP